MGEPRARLLAAFSAVAFLALLAGIWTQWPESGPITVKSFKIPENENLLERLARLSTTDKQWGMHKYTDVYAQLFSTRRTEITNLTEVGIMFGDSMTMWASYFPNAQIHGVDPNFIEAEAALRKLQESTLCNKCARIGACPSCKARMFLHRGFSNQQELLDAGLISGTMDIVIDDAGDHSRHLQELLFPLYWPLVKPGGYYLIEDVDSQKGGDDYVSRYSSLSPEVRDAMEKHHTFFVDSTPGFSDGDWRGWQKDLGPRWVRSRVVHNSHLLVIRKRSPQDQEAPPRKASMPMNLEKKLPNTATGALREWLVRASKSQSDMKQKNAS